MAIFYLMFVGCYVISMLATYMNKKFQLTSGMGFFATCVYLVINGIVSAVAPVIVMLLTGQKIEVTSYSLVMAFATVLCAAMATSGSLKAYEKGQMAVVSVFGTIGSIVISCVWGIFFLKEEITFGQGVGIALMIASVVTVIIQKNVKIRRDALWLLILVAVCDSLISVLSKQHQVETKYETVNTLSYSMWVGIIRAVVFSLLILAKKGKNSEKVKLTKPALMSAFLAAAAGGTAYILTLITAKVLPLTITSPLGTALSILLTTLMAWIGYHEKLSKQQIAGLVLCLAGIFVFAWC